MAYRGNSGNDGVHVYVDGACISNGKADAQAGCGVWFGPNNPYNVSEPVRGVPQTNNNAEIQAATKAISQAEKMGHKNVTVRTDSEFLVKGTTEWMPKWKQNGWRTANNEPVKNKTSFQQLDSAMSRMSNVKFEHVPGHRGVAGNEAADALAKQGAKMYTRY